jgi:hypothetical protein
MRAQITANRAKAKADETNGPKSRFRDRGAEGKRPWKRTLPQEWLASLFLHTYVDRLFESRWLCALLGATE